MSSFEADQIRIEIMTGDTTRVVELATRDGQKVRVLIKETLFPAAGTTDGVEQAAVDFAAMGPTPVVDDSTAVATAVEP